MSAKVCTIKSYYFFFNATAQGKTGVKLLVAVPFNSGFQPLCFTGFRVFALLPLQNIYIMQCCVTFPLSPLPVTSGIPLPVNFPPPPPSDLAANFLLGGGGWLSCHPLDVLWLEIN